MLIVALAIGLCFVLRGLKSPIKHDSIASTSNGKLTPESLYTITINDSSVRYDFPNGQHQEIQWSDLTQVDIQTTDEGPMLPDVFWVLIGTHAKCVIAQGAAGEQALVERLQRLPHFHNNQLINAMSSTSSQRFVCWRRVEHNA